MQIGQILARPDRFVEVTGTRDREMVAAFSTDGGAVWHAATIYPGHYVDQWRAADPAVWNRAVTAGIMPAGDQAVLWNYFFDIDTPAGSVLFRVRNASDGAVLAETPVDLAVVDDTTIIDRRNITALCRGVLPAPWSLKVCPAGETGVESIHRVVERREIPVDREQPRAEIVNADLSPLRIGAGVKGWHRIYLGMEPYSACRFWLTGQGVWYEAPNWNVDAPNNNRHIKSDESDRLRQEFYIGSADLTHQDLCISAGGARNWRDVSIRYIKLVPMTQFEIDHFTGVRDLAQKRGRPFAGYMEPCTPATTEPVISTMRDHIRNRVRQNVLRGSDEVFVHVIRLGSRAWYHSDVVERLMEGPEDGANEHGWLHFMHWMRQGDPMEVAIEEARQAGLKILSDVGMNSTYYGAHAHYGVLTDRFPKAHPEFLCPERQGCFDYRFASVREYVTSVIRELLLKYDTDGINLDFARWGYRPAYDVPSLLAVLEETGRIRTEAEQKWAHPVVVSARIPYEAPNDTGEAPDDTGEGEPVFTEALSQWARRGLVNRFMVCLHDHPVNRVEEGTFMGHYVDAVRGCDVSFWLDMYQGTWFNGGGPVRDLEIARSLVRQGLDGGVFYYMSNRPVEWERINWQMKLLDMPDVIVDPHHPPSRMR